MQSNNLHNIIKQPDDETFKRNRLRSRNYDKLQMLVENTIIHSLNAPHQHNKRKRLIVPQYNKHVFLINTPSTIYLYLSIYPSIYRTRNKIAQAYTHTQWHMNNAWSQTIYALIALPFIVFLLLIISYKQYWIIFLSTILSLLFSITFLSITNNLLLYLLYSLFASSQRLLNSFTLLKLDAYPLQVVWLA